MMVRTSISLLFSLLMQLSSSEAAQTQPAELLPVSDTGYYALVAGGSHGIGLGLAEALAKRHFNLILIARHFDSLETARNNLQSKYGVHVEIISQDLSLPDAAVKIADWCKNKSIRLKILCNVAGFGGSRDYLSNLPLDSLRYMIHLNSESAMALTYTLLPLLEANSPSYILNVASMAALAPIPIKNLYAATKSEVLFFSYALHYQLKGKKIYVSCLCPGPVLTKPEIVKTTKKELGWFGMQMALMPDKVGEVAVRRTLKRRMLIVPGTLAYMTSILLRVLPLRWTTFIYYKLG
jgi:hypothetical protein